MSPDWSFDEQLGAKLLIEPLEQFVWGTVSGQPPPAPRRSSLCGRVFKQGEPAYSCRECGEFFTRLDLICSKFQYPKTYTNFHTYTHTYHFNTGSDDEVNETPQRIAVRRVCGLFRIVISKRLFGELEVRYLGCLRPKFAWSNV